MIKTNVSETAEIMDKCFPQWANKIDIRKLNLSDAYNCILGQCSLLENSNATFDTLRQNGYKVTGHFSDNTFFSDWIIEILTRRGLLLTS